MGRDPGEVGTGKYPSSSLDRDVLPSGEKDAQGGQGPGPGMRTGLHAAVARATPHRICLNFPSTKTRVRKLSLSAGPQQPLSMVFHGAWLGRALIPLSFLGIDVIVITSSADCTETV